MIIREHQYEHVIQYSHHKNIPSPQLVQSQISSQLNISSSAGKVRKLGTDIRVFPTVINKLTKLIKLLFHICHDDRWNGHTLNVVDSSQAMCA